MKATTPISRIYLFIVALGMIYHSVSSNPQVLKGVKHTISSVWISSGATATGLSGVVADNQK